jgi:enamine deaminase RidA (YjgF/YER057c/UK114 family)
MTLQRVNPASLAPPIGFSHAVVVQSGTLVLLAGQTALDDTGQIVGSTIVEQFEKVMTNLLTALSAAGGSPENLAKLTIRRTIALMPRRLVASGGDWLDVSTRR